MSHHTRWLSQIIVAGFVFTTSMERRRVVASEGARWAGARSTGADLV